jgi:hypothetical protein
MKIIKYIIIASIIYQLLDVSNIKITTNNKIKIIIVGVTLVYCYDLSTENLENVFENKTNLEDLFKKIDKDITITKVSSVTPSDISSIDVSSDIENNVKDKTIIKNGNKKEPKQSISKEPKQSTKKEKDCSAEIKKLKDSILSLENKLKGDDEESSNKSNNNSSKKSKNKTFKRKKSKKNFNVNSEIMTKKNNKKERKANNMKYMEMLFDKLKEEGLITEDDIEKMKRKLNAGIDDVSSIIMKLEKLNNNSMKYSVKDDEYYKSLGSGISKKWSDKYTILDTKNWAVPAYKPPVCVTNMRCKVCPDNTSGYPVNLMEWDESTKVSNTSINKKWANSQDTETNSD